MTSDQKAGLAVLTGDLIGYTEWPQAKRGLAFDALRNAAAHIGRWPCADGSSHLERVRGDGWQFALVAPHYALRVALTFRAALRGAEAEFGAPKRPPPDLDTRIAIGLGPAANFDPERLADADSEAFVLSGRGLDAMDEAPGIRLLSSGDPSREFLLESALVRMCDAISRHWTARQAAVMRLALAPGRHRREALAEQLGILRQSVEGHLIAAQAEALSIALEEIEQQLA